MHMTRTGNDILGERMAVFEQAATYAVETLSRISMDALDRPSPCHEWSVREVVLHLADVSDAVIGLIRTGELVLPTPRAGDTADAVAVARERIHALREVAAGATSDVASSELLLDALRAAANELAAHGWDIATALDMRRPIPDATATALLALAESKLTDTNRADKFAAALPISSAASPSERFVAYLGRQAP
jgi:uncharacterized protein (TIGR03086 family)